MFGPVGVALLASTLAIRRARKLATTFVPPSDEDARAFIGEVGYDTYAEARVGHPGTLEIRQMHALDAVYTQSVAELLAERVPGLTVESSYPIQLCLNELLQNVFEWAASPSGCFVLTRWYKKTRSVRLAVVDRGIGIPATLRRTKVQSLHRESDAAVIEAAVTTPRLTAWASKVGGLGLKTIHEVVCGNGGRLTIVSLGAKVTWAGKRKASRFRSPPLRGTAVEIEIRPLSLEPSTSEMVF